MPQRVSGKNREDPLGYFRAAVAGHAGPDCAGACRSDGHHRPSVTMGGVEILLWLVPAVVVTTLAGLWAGWVTRQRPERERTEAEQERFARAITKPLPPAARPRPGSGARRPRERSTGVAVRRNPPGDPRETRRTA